MHHQQLSDENMMLNQGDYSMLTAIFASLEIITLFLGCEQYCDIFNTPSEDIHQACYI
jgi:hypothetical protein